MILESTVNQGKIPADIILFESSDDFVVQSYLEAFDPKNRHLYFLRTSDQPVLPESATAKKGLKESQEAYKDVCILDAANFVPMGATFTGSGKGICIRIGTNTV